MTENKNAEKSFKPAVVSGWASFQPDKMRLTYFVNKDFTFLELNFQICHV